MMLASGWALWVDEAGSRLDVLQADVGAGGDVDDNAVGPGDAGLPAGGLDTAALAAFSALPAPLALPVPM